MSTKEIHRHDSHRGALELNEGIPEDQLELKNRALAVAAEGVTIADARLPDRPLIYANEGFERTTGYSVSEVMGRNCRFLQGSDSDPVAVEEIRTAIREERSCLVEILNYRKDGTTFWNRLSITPVRDADGDLTHFIGVQSDITARKHAEEALLEANLLLEDKNQRLLNDLEAAASVQRALLPADLPTPDGARFAWSFRPCDQLAGDMLNVVQLDENRVGLYIIDVSGHGVRAALLSVTLSHTLSDVRSRSCLFSPSGEGSESFAVSPPVEVLESLNRQFQMDPRTRQYFTMVYGILDRRSRLFRYVSAGHPAIVQVPRVGRPCLLEEPGFPIGLTKEPSYVESRLQLNPGDRLYLYTDGLIEASPSDDVDDEFGQDRLVAELLDHRSESLENSVRSLGDSVEAWCADRPLEDDVSILAFELDD